MLEQWRHKFWQDGKLRRGHTAGWWSKERVGYCRDGCCPHKVPVCQAPYEEPNWRVCRNCASRRELGITSPRRGAYPERFVGFTGGRSYTPTDEDWWKAGLLLWALGPVRVVVGDCNVPRAREQVYWDSETMRHRLEGVDAHVWFRYRVPEPRVFRAKWVEEGRVAGPNRNGLMCGFIDALIAFPGGAGTADCVRQAEARSVPVYKITDMADLGRSGRHGAPPMGEIRA